VTTRTKLLFVCSQNKIRSLTAESLFRDSQTIDARSAGTNPDARVRVTAGLIGWADRIFVMEKRHANILRKKFRDELQGKPLGVLYIPDEYEPMEPALVEILSMRLATFLSPGQDDG
jgi:predicted protein tyrosine phosphatase